MMQPSRVFFAVGIAALFALSESTAFAQGRRSGGDESRRREEGRDRDSGDRGERDGERERSFAERIRERFGGGGGGFGGEFGGGFGGGGMGEPFGGRGNPWSGGGESRGDNSGNNSDTIKEKPRVTVDLPDGYLAGDLDGDGQIGFYEWRLWQKTGAAQFARWDANSDGFLTPRELAGVPPPSGTAASAAAVASSSSASRSNAPVNPFGVAGATRTPAPAGSSRPVAGGPVSLDEADPIVLKARNYFSLMDENKDGQISAEELDKSNRVKSMFKNAGIDLTQPMSSAQFIETYVRVSST